MVTPGSLFDPELGKAKTPDDKSTTKSSSTTPVQRPAPSNIYDRRSETFKKFLTNNKKSAAEEDEEESLLAQASTTGVKSPLDMATTTTGTSGKKTKPMTGQTGKIVASVDPSLSESRDATDATGDATSDEPTEPTEPIVPNVIPGPNMAVTGKANIGMRTSGTNVAITNATDVKEGSAETPLQPTRNELLQAAIGKETKKKIASDTEIKGSEKTAGTTATATAQVMLTNAPAPTPTNQIQTVVQATNDTQGAQAALNKRVESIKIIEKLVSSLVQQIKPDRTETTITLKDLPLFKDVTVVITEYNTSQKEFNLTFYNLTNPEARNLIQTNQTALREALIEKGYTLQMITIEPKIETSASTSEETTSQRGDQEQQMAGGGGSSESAFDEGGVT